jgi:hypothetical protein
MPLSAGTPRSCSNHSTARPKPRTLVTVRFDNPGPSTFPVRYPQVHNARIAEVLRRLDAEDTIP